MKRKQHSVLLVGLLALGLAACSSHRMRGETASTASSPSATESTYGERPAGDTTASSGAMTGQSTTSGATAGTTSTGAAGTTSGDTMGQASTATGEMPMHGQTHAGAQASAAPPNSVVTMIEVVPRQGEATGAGTMAGAAVGGTAAGTSDRVYRITLRMDDGSTRVITQEWAPTFRSGDRVNLSGGEIQRR